MIQIPAKLLLFALACLAPLDVAQAKRGKLDAADKARIRTAPVKIVRFESPPLDIMTPRDAVGKGLIADLTRSDEMEGHGTHRFHPDKALHQQVATAFRESELVERLEVVEPAYPFHMPKELKDLSRYQDEEAEYIIELIIPLGGWQAAYNPIKWKTYWLNFFVEARIIRTSDMKQIWKTRVFYAGLKDKRLRFHISELEEDGKAKIAAIRDIAAAEIANRIVAAYQKAD